MMENIKNIQEGLQGFQIKIPKNRKCITIHPIAPLLQFPLFSEDVLSKIGVIGQLKKQWNGGQFFSIFPSCSSWSCKAASMESINEINHQPRMEQKKNKYVNDQVKKNKYKEVFAEVGKKYGKMKCMDMFQDVYEHFGNVDEQQWIKIINKEICK